jgi:hypothetical protein
MRLPRLRVSAVWRAAAPAQGGGRVQRSPAASTPCAAVSDLRGHPDLPRGIGRSGRWSIPPRAGGVRRETTDDWGARFAVDHGSDRRFAVHDQINSAFMCGAWFSAAGRRRCGSAEGTLPAEPLGDGDIRLAGKISFLG